MKKKNDLLLLYLAMLGLGVIAFALMFQILWILFVILSHTTDFIQI